MSTGRGRSHEPVPLRDAVAAVGRELGIPGLDALATLTGSWREVVGEPLVAHATLRSVRDGVCTIEVDGSGWATQLRYSEQQLLERADTCCGPGVVTSIRVVVKGPETAAP